MSIRDYSSNIKSCILRCNPSCLYSSTDNGLFTRSMPTKYHHLPASVCLHICMFCLCVCMRGFRKFCQRGSNSDNVFFVFVFCFFMKGELRGEGGSKYRYKRAINGPPAKRHWNGVSLAGRCWPNIECCLGFSGDPDQYYKDTLYFLGGGGGARTPCPPPLNPHMVCMCERTTRNTQSWKIQIRSQKYGHLHELHFILYLTFTASLYDGKICHTWEWWDQ